MLDVFQICKEKTNYHFNQNNFRISLQLPKFVIRNSGQKRLHLAKSLSLAPFSPLIQNRNINFFLITCLLVLFIEREMSTDISRRILQVHAFGRNNFKLGTLYDARTDEVVPTGIMKC